ncbi:hypothetical protein HOY80DRAFT_1060368 [Tuber brumale]|nr:hypothetical protein HOY80DRAFT_1060368 [Tuber brumale]
MSQNLRPDRSRQIPTEPQGRDGAKIVVRSGPVFLEVSLRGRQGPQTVANTAVNRYLRFTWASGGFAWAPSGFDVGCAKTRPGGCLDAAGLWPPLRISAGLTQAFQN